MLRCRCQRLAAAARKPAERSSRRSESLPKTEGKRERRRIGVSWFTHTLDLKSTLQGASGWGSSPLAAHDSSSGGTSRTGERSENASPYCAQRLSHSKETLSSTRERVPLDKGIYLVQKAHTGRIGLPLAWPSCNPSWEIRCSLRQSGCFACLQNVQKFMRDHDRRCNTLLRVRSASI